MFLCRTLSPDHYNISGFPGKSSKQVEISRVFAFSCEELFFFFQMCPRLAQGSTVCCKSYAKDARYICSPRVALYWISKILRRISGRQRSLGGNEISWSTSVAALNSSQMLSGCVAKVLLAQAYTWPIFTCFRSTLDAKVHLPRLVSSRLCECRP